LTPFTTYWTAIPLFATV